MSEMKRLKQLATREDLLSSGHRACPGCAGPIIIRQVLMAAQEENVHLVGAIATGCMEVVTTVYPHSAWRIPMVHSAFENAASTISGVEGAYRSLKRQKKIDKDIRFIAFGGDGGTYDIGLQALSGALERGHRFTYICYDNGAYMNTGIQRSSATPKGAFTMTAQAGREAAGKSRQRKDLTKIVAAHGVPYVAQASPHKPEDLTNKIGKAIAAEGPGFINVLSPCPRGWRYAQSDTIQMARLGVQTCVWPLYEIVDGQLTVTHTPKKKKPVSEWLESQGRFKHLFQPDNKPMIDEIQANVDAQWKQLMNQSGKRTVSG